MVYFCERSPVSRPTWVSLFDSEMTHSLSTERLVFVSASVEELHRLLRFARGVRITELAPST